MHKEEEEEEEEVCRVCRTGESADNPLRHPCKCNGSIKWVHESCLVEWLQHSQQLKCELCGHEFHFARVYAPNTPARLPLRVFVFGMLAYLARLTRKAGRIMLATFCWLGVVPLYTGWVFSFYFRKQKHEVADITATNETASLNATMPEQTSAPPVSLDLGIAGQFVFGTLVSACILSVSFAMLILLDYVLQQTLGVGEGEVAGDDDAAPLDQDQDTAAREGDAGVDNVDDWQGEADRVLQPQQANAEADADAEAQPHVDQLPAQLPQQVDDDIFFGLNFLDDINLVELAGLQGSLVSLFCRCVILSLYNSLFIFVFFVIPHRVGALAWRRVQQFELQAVPATAVGYFLLFVALSVWLSAALAARRGFPVRFLQIMELCYNFVKVSALLLFSLGVFPVMLGFSIQLATLDFSGLSVGALFSITYRFPILLSISHWFVGIIYAFAVVTAVTWVRKVVRREHMWFVRDPTDPEFHPLREMIDRPWLHHLRRFALSSFVYATLITLTMYLPGRLVLLAFSSHFPLVLHSLNPFSDGSMQLVFVNVCAPLLAEYLRPRELAQAALLRWIVTVSHLLGIDDWLLVPGGLAAALEDAHDDAQRQQAAHPPAQEQAQQQQAEAAPPQPAIADAAGYAAPPPPPPEQQQEPAEDQQAAQLPPPPSRLAVRLTALLGLAWLTLSCLNASLVVPLLLGRFVLRLLFSTFNDVYAFLVGVSLSLLVARAACVVGAYIARQRAATATAQLAVLCAAWLYHATRAATVAALALVALPFACGLLFDVAVATPLVVPLDECPAHLYFQDWIIGLICVKLWYHADAFRAGTVQAELAAARHAGLRGFSVRRLLRVLVPSIVAVLVPLAAPWALARLLTRVLALPPGGHVETMLMRYGHAVWLAGYASALLASAVVTWTRTLHNCIRDDAYLVGRHLVDSEDVPQQQQRAQQPR
eukprot:TRINITY_DN148_c0_g2_i1.p1 TRINITY_DN148_c0_g2~~TRINITY_DN148_c0_g2_i1.p1  ORF type:complete len:937 (+),score=249.39 TRINITY_DN148_c0_g2_i1:2-2812(+)